MLARGCLLVWCSIGLASAASPARASDASGHELLVRTLSADPSAPTLRFGWMQGTRGRMSLTITLLGDLEDDGFALLFEPLLETHNTPEQAAPVPFEYWRGRMSLELAHRWALDDGASLALGLRAEHESDHASVPAFQPVVLGRGPAFVYVNDLALRASWSAPLGGVLLGAAATARLHLATCTVRVRACEEVSFGGVGPELAADLVLDSEGGRTDVDLAVTAALHGRWVLETDRAEGEEVLVVLVGLRLPTTRRGTFRVEAGLQAGSELGMLRHRRSVMAGGFVAWAL